MYMVSVILVTMQSYILLFPNQYLKFTIITPPPQKTEYFKPVLPADTLPGGPGGPGGP